MVKSAEIQTGRSLRACQMSDMRTFLPFTVFKAASGTCALLPSGHTPESQIQRRKRGEFNLDRTLEAGAATDGEAPLATDRLRWAAVPIAKAVPV
jgi:hypothetical protein